MYTSLFQYLFSLKCFSLFKINNPQFIVRGKLYYNFVKKNFGITKYQTLENENCTFFLKVVQVSQWHTPGLLMSRHNQQTDLRGA